LNAAPSGSFPSSNRSRINRQFPSDSDVPNNNAVESKFICDLEP
jgi:hypothetical protein